MGMSLGRDGWFDYEGVLGENKCYLDLKFHTSWDWLIPVVQKIESLGYVFTIQGGKAEFGEMISKPQCFTSKDKLSSTYDAVVRFIRENTDTERMMKIRIADMDSDLD